VLYNHRLVPVSDRFAIANVLVEELSKKYSSVLDLGAGHCRFSQMAHKWGMKVTAMDARTVRRPKLPTDISYVEGDFLKVDVPGDFDVILMLGIFYHLTVAEQHILMSKYKGRPVLLDTHYAPEDGSYENGKYRGQDYQEGPNLEMMKKNPKASFTSLVSFWHTEKSLVDFLSEYFSTVTKISPEHHPERTFFICEP